MNEPKVSVIVLSYNSAATVEQALDSVLGQVCTFEYEVVVGDDASTDGTLFTAREAWSNDEFLQKNYVEEIS